MKDVFLDGASNTPLDEAVFEAMKRYLAPGFVGNSFSTHSFGIESFQAIENAREQVAKATMADIHNIYFTSGATESNNWAIYSVARTQLLTGMKKPKIVCGVTEHSSVLNACKQLHEFGFEIEFIKSNTLGRVTLAEALEVIDNRTCLVCIMAVNNEIGVENDAVSIAAFARDLGACVLIDCTQAIAFGGESTELCRRFPCANYFSFSAHKFYGPTGVGCLIARNGAPVVPMFYGGAQEFGKRGGTSNTAAIVGLGKAIELLHNNNYSGHYYDLFRYFDLKLMITELGTLNVYPDCPNILSVNFLKSLNVQNLASLLATEGIAVSAGSACDAEHDNVSGFNPSHVLSAMKLTENMIRNTIRVSFTKYTTSNDIDQLFEAIKNIINDLQGDYNNE